MNVLKTVVAFACTFALAACGSGTGAVSGSDITENKSMNISLGTDDFIITNVEYCEVQETGAIHYRMRVKNNTNTDVDGLTIEGFDIDENGDQIGTVGFDFYDIEAGHEAWNSVHAELDLANGFGGFKFTSYRVYARDSDGILSSDEIITLPEKVSITREQMNINSKLAGPN